MSKSCSQGLVQADGETNGRRTTCDTLATLLALLALSRAGQTMADERSVLSLERQSPDFTRSFERPAVVPPPFALPATYQTMGVPEVRTFSTQEFRPHGQSIVDQRIQADAAEEAPMLRGSTVWQRLRDFRSHGRVRLLTLWETGGSSVSLQAGKKGEPSLQWTSRGMNRGGATRGLFDHLFSVSLAGASRGMRPAPRPGSADAAVKPSNFMDVGPRR